MTSQINRSCTPTPPNSPESKAVLHKSQTMPDLRLEVRCHMCDKIDKLAKYLLCHMAFCDEKCLKDYIFAIVQNVRSHEQ